QIPWGREELCWRSSNVRSRRILGLMHHLVQQIRNVLMTASNNWLSFRQLALRVTGDVQDADLIAAIVESQPNLFCVHGDRRCKIRAEVIEAETDITRSRDVQSPPVHLQAAEAVRQYAGQLNPLRVRIIAADTGKVVL